MRFRTLVWREMFNRKSRLATSFLANGPESILADEPTGNLDPETRRQVISFLQEINEEGPTVVLVAHAPDAAAKAKRTLRIVEGQIHA